MIAHVVMCTGWTWEQSEAELDMPRLLALVDYWRDHPPLHALVAAYLGVKPSRKTGAVNDQAEIDALLSGLTQTL